MIKNWCKDNANERNESLLSNCRVQLIFCKDTYISLKSLYLVFGRYYHFNRYFSFPYIFSLIFDDDAFASLCQYSSERIFLALHHSLKYCRISSLAFS